MKNTATKLIALLLVLTFVFAFAACGKDDEVTTTAPGETTTAAETTTEEATTVDGETTDPNATTDPDATTDPNATTDTDATTQAATEAGKPQTTAEILAAYTSVMNKAKASKPAYKKIEFQALPNRDGDRKFEKGGTLIGTMLRLAGLFMTEESKADVENQQKGNDMKWFPVPHSDKGNLLTNTNAIKSAKCDELADGNYKITIVLKDEKNPEPYKAGAAKAPSNTGAMFNPLSRADIDDTLKNDGAVKTVVRNATYDLTYYNCKAELVYNPKTEQVVKLNQFMSVKIDIMEPTKVGFSDVKGYATLTNTMRAWDFMY